MKILVIQQKMIGDVLVSSLLCENLRLAYPKAEIHYLVNDNTVEVLLGNTSFDKLVIFDKKQQESFVELLKFSWSLRAEKYDIVIDAYSKLQSWIMVLLCGGKRKISYRKTGRTFLYTDNVIKSKEPKSYLGLSIEHRLSLLEPLNLMLKEEVEPKLYISEAEDIKGKEILAQHQIPTDRKTVMISLIGSDHSKTYPLEYMSALVDYIGTNYHVNILFNYFPKQREQALTIYNLCSKNTQDKIFFDLIGSSLRDYIIIMNQCDLIVGNDGGAINMAKALNKPSFIVFSPWIDKETWATFEDGVKHVSTHLRDVKPDLIAGKKVKDLKAAYANLYQEFKPEYIIPTLQKFLNQHLKN